MLLLSTYHTEHEGVLQEPDPRLRTMSEKISRIDNNVRSIAAKLVEVLKQLDKPYLPWQGLAAPQIGQNARIVVIKRKYGQYQIMINPQFLEERLTLPTISGCYSLKGLYLRISPFWVKISYTDMDNKNHTETFWGGKATLLKQEIDHLNGKLISD